MAWVRRHHTTHCSKAAKSRGQPSPNIHTLRGLSHSTVLRAAQTGLDRPLATWIRATLVDHDGTPWTNIHVPKRQLHRGIFIVPYQACDPATMRFPLSDQWVRSPPPLPSHTPDMVLVHAVTSEVRSWRSCFTPMAIARIEEIWADLARDERYADSHKRPTGRAETHRGPAIMVPSPSNTTLTSHDAA